MLALRLRERRVVLGLTQQELSAALGLSFQQVYKYERGRNRISAGRLSDLSKALGAPVTFFFDDVADTSTPVAPLASGEHNDPLGRREAAEFFAAYRAISNQRFVTDYDNLQKLFQWGRTVRAQQRPAPRAKRRKERFPNACG